MSSTDKAAMDCRAVVTEAHEATRDLRTAIKEAREVNSTLAQKAIDERLEPIVVAEIAKMQKAVLDQIDRATKRVYERFDKIGDVLLHEEGGESLAQLLTRVGKALRARQL